MFIPIVREERIPTQTASEPDDFAHEHPVLDAGDRLMVPGSDRPTVAMPWSRGGR